MNENIEYKLKKLLVDFEEMEKRIKANKNLLDKSSQNIKDEIAQEIQTISQEITSCKTLVNEMATSIAQNTQDIAQNTTDIAQNTQNIEDNTSKITQNSTKITEINTKIGNISQINEKMTQISTSIENLSQIINNLQLNDNSQLIYQDVGVNEDYVLATVNCNFTYGHYYSQSYFLVCDINQYIDIDFELEYDPTSLYKYSTATYKIELVINDEVFVSGEYPLSSSNDVKTFSKRFFPTKKINEIRVHCTGSPACLAKQYKIVVRGKNLTFVGEVPSVSVTCFDNKYYICNKSDKNDAKLYFAELEKDNLTLNTTDYSYGDLSKIAINENYSICPTYNYSTGKYIKYCGEGCLFITMENRFKTNNLYFNFYNINDNNENIFQDYCNVNIAAIDYDYAFTGKSPVCACLSVATNEGRPLLIATPEQTTYNRVYLKLNNELLPYVYYRCAIVKNNNLTTSDNGGSYHGALFWNITTQNWEFFEKYDNTYKVILSPGKYCTAYYQSDGSINVYISRGCTTYKYTLIKNAETNEYELSGTFSTIPKCTKYDELYDGKALITCYNSYSIYSPSESV